MIPNAAVIYSNGSQECERVIALLKALHTDLHEYRLNQHFTQRGFEAEFGEGAEYPQVAIGSKHVGTLKETLQHLDNKGMLS
tara:strand:+ start:491 stop:736 length:246 start_codon:yes stop_codon:yes gene_type:complete